MSQGHHTVEYRSIRHWDLWEVEVAAITIVSFATAAIIYDLEKCNRFLCYINVAYNVIIYGTGNDTSH